MKTNNFYRILWCVLLSASLLAVPMQSAFSCTRAVYFGKEGQTVTGRSMDWLEDMQSNLYVFPRNMARDGGLGDKSLKWTSKYGSVITSGYEGGTADGMNEKVHGPGRHAARHRHQRVGPVLPRQLRNRRRGRRRDPPGEVPHGRRSGPQRHQG